jgi:hypothetical protein
MDAKLFTTTTTNTPKTSKHRYFTRASIGKNKKPNDSDDDVDSSIEDVDEIEYTDEEEDDDDKDYEDEEEEEEDDEDYEDDEDEEEEEVEIDVKKYRELLAELFPSKFSSKKAIKTKPSKVKSNPDDYNADYINPYENGKKTIKEINTKKTKIISKKEKISKNDDYDDANTDSSDEDYDESDNDDEDEDEDEDEDYDEEDAEENFVVKRQGNGQKSKNIHLMLTIGGGNKGSLQEDEDDDDYYEDEDEYEEDETEEELALIKKAELELARDEPALQKIKNVLDKFTDDEKEMPIFKKTFKDYAKREKNIEIRKTTIDTIIKTQNTRKFQKNISDKNQFNEVDYFRDKMTQDEQKKALVQLEEIRLHTRIEKPYKLALLDASIPVHVKSIALKKINILKYIDPSSGEFYKIKNWIDTFMQIPFGKFNTLPVTIDDGIEKCHNFMDNAKTILDNAVYGLNDAKIQIMQMIGQWIANPKAFGSAIAIKGPMGTGKTSLVKEGISKILEREFAFVALGGASDGSFLEGHSYTYEGSVWGRIVDILIKSKSMNPVIFFDELDKVSDTTRGDEIIGILTHLTDSSQNNKFHDKYFGDLEFDLSRCLFIFSYNDESKINPILRDRMYRIQTSGYDVNDKLTISSQYLIPKIQEQVRFDKSDIIIPDDTIRYIVSKNTENEQGVRNLKRCLEIIYMKLNLYRLVKPGTVMFKSDMMTNVSFPITVTPDIVDHLIKQPEENVSWRQMFL